MLIKLPNFMIIAVIKIVRGQARDSQTQKVHTVWAEAAVQVLTGRRTKKKRPQTTGAAHKFLGVWLVVYEGAQLFGPAGMAQFP